MTKQKREYIERPVVKETEKAYLVKVFVNNRRDGSKIKTKWVAKSRCIPMCEERQKAYDNIPDEFKQYVEKYVGVPTQLIGDAEWE